MKRIINHKILFLLSLTLFIKLGYAAPVILVGTTGDYPPLTAKSESDFSGIDIDIIKKFAKDNNLNLKFVPTTWQTLSNDLSSSKFVIAVGGISANPERSKLFYLSNAIESSAKAAMIRCTDKQRFTNFAAIDSESVIVSENRGGTNQDFALKNIKHATIRLVAKNDASIVSLISVPPLADVMFTDDIEISYRHEQNPKLCLAQIPEKFPGSPKIFLFAKTAEGQKLQQLFNEWWVKRH